MPQIWIVAGPNGAGKSTLVNRFNRDRIAFINPDVLFAANPEAGLIGAGRRALELQKRFLDERRDFLIETTFSGKRELGLMRSAARAGFKVNLVFVAVESALLSQGRVAVRVAEGGHHVPWEDIRRRRERTLANLPIGLDIADRAVLFDNSGEKHRLLLVKDKGRLRRVARSIPAWLTPHLPKAWTRQLGRDRGMER